MRVLLGFLSLACFFIGVFILLLLFGSLSAPGNSTMNTIVIAVVVMAAFALAVVFRAYRSRLAA